MADMMRVPGAANMASTHASSPNDVHILEFAPPMPAGFWGEVVYRYQDGKFTTAEVKRLLKNG